MTTPQIRAQRAKDIEDAVIVMAMTAFAEAMRGDTTPGPIDAWAVGKLRAEYALPIALGLLRAATRFVWVTAPTGGTHGDLLRTLESNLEVVANEVVSGDLPAGEFWITVAAAQAPQG